MSCEARDEPDRAQGDEAPQEVVVVGVGNLLLGDEGLGVHAVRALASRESVASRARLIDAGTALFDVMAECRDAATMILVDAVRAGRPAGTVYRLPLDLSELPTAPAPGGLSLHDWATLDVLAAASLMGALPRRVVIMGIEPASLEPGASLSPAVARSLDALLAAIVREIAGDPV